MTFTDLLKAQYLIGGIIALAWIGFLIWAWLRGRGIKPWQEYLALFAISCIGTVIFGALCLALLG